MKHPEIQLLTRLTLNVFPPGECRVTLNDCIRDAQAQLVGITDFHNVVSSPRWSEALTYGKCEGDLSRVVNFVLGELIRLMSEAQSTATGGGDASPPDQRA